MMIRLLLILLPVFSFGQMSTLTLPYVIENINTIMVGNKVYVEISPRRAFGDKPCESLEELQRKFDLHLLTEKIIIRDTTIGESTQHYQYYLNYRPYMRVDYDIYTDGKLYYMDFETYIGVSSSIKNFTELKINY